VDLEMGEQIPWIPKLPFKTSNGISLDSLSVGQYSWIILIWQVKKDVSFHKYRGFQENALTADQYPHGIFKGFRSTCKKQCW
jgi:hypothetical protein